MTAPALQRSRRAETPPVPSLDKRWPIQLLWESRPALGAWSRRGGTLPAGLVERFSGQLAIPLRADRPTIVANFVATLDGVVAFDRTGATGGREISGGSEPDRFVMGLLRASADAVLVGAATVRASRTHGWGPRDAHPGSAAAFAAWRRDLGLPTAGPATLILSASGALEQRDLPLDPDAPVVVITTDAGAHRLRRQQPRHGRVEIVSVADGPRVPIEALLTFLCDRGYGIVLSEGGPSVFGELLAARIVDELFLTVAPQLAGRSADDPRLGLVEGVGFSPADAPWLQLRSVMRSGDHLFLRYQGPFPDRKDLS